MPSAPTFAGQGPAFASLRDALESREKTQLTTFRSLCDRYRTHFFNISVSHSFGRRNSLKIILSWGTTYQHAISIWARPNNLAQVGAKSNGLFIPGLFSPTQIPIEREVAALCLGTHPSSLFDVGGFHVKSLHEICWEYAFEISQLQISKHKETSFQWKIKGSELCGTIISEDAPWSQYPHIYLTPSAEDIYLGMWVSDWANYQVSLGRLVPTPQRIGDKVRICTAIRDSFNDFVVARSQADIKVVTEVIHQTLPAFELPEGHSIVRIIPDYVDEHAFTEIRRYGTQIWQVPTDRVNELETWLPLLKSLNRALVSLLSVI